MFMDQRDSMLRTQRSCALPGGESDPGQAAVSRERPRLTSSLSVGSIPFSFPHRISYGTRKKVPMIAVAPATLPLIACNTPS